MKKILILIFFFPLFSLGQIISQYVETNKGSSPKGIEIYNNTGATLDFSATNLTVWLEQNGASESLKHTISSGTLAPNEVLVIGTSGMQTDVQNNNPNCQFYTEGWQFNGNDNLIVKLDGNVTDTFGRALNNGTAYYSSYATVKSSNQNIERKLGIFSGDLDFFNSTQSNSDNISLYYNTVVNFPSGYPDGASEVTEALQGFGVPPDNIMYSGGWKTWDSSTDATSTTAPIGSNVKPIYIASGSASLSTTGLSFPSVEIKSGATLTVDASSDLKISSTAASLSYNSGNLINNGTLILNSDVNGYSSLRVEGSMTGNLTYRRWINDISSASPTNADPGWDLVGSPVSSATVNTTSLAQNSSNNNYAIQPYNNQTNSWTSTSGSTLALTDMVGYSMAMPEGSPGTIDFTGTLINSHQSVTISNYVGSGSGTQWNLVSNPYPEFIALNSAAASATDASSNFLWYNGFQDGEDVLGHTDSEVAVYYWDGDEYNTGTQSDTKLFAAPGSAFFVSSASGTSNSLDFRTAMRILGSDSGLTSTNDWIGDINESDNRAELFVDVTQNEFRAKTELFFLNDVTNGLDPGYDGRQFPHGNNTVTIYSRLVNDDNGINFGDQALPFSEMWDKVIPLGINALGGEEMTVSISHRTTPADLNIYLEDAQEGTMTNLLDGDYVLTPTSDLEGVGRFFIHMTADTMSNGEVSTSMLNAYKEIDASYITIEGLATQTNETKVSLYNILGREVLSTTLNNNMGTQTISTVGLSAGIYVIELESGSDRLTKKLLIQ